MDQFLNIVIWDDKSIADLLTPEFLLSTAGNIMLAIAMLMAGFILGGWVGRRIKRLGEKYEHLDDTLFNFMGNITRYIVVGFSFLFVLNTFGVQTTSFVAVIGAAGLAIGLALQGTLSNVAAGVMIIFFRPFKLGDFVTINGRMGTVKDITLNNTELASLSNHQVIIPNAEVWGHTIENYSVYPTRRAEWTFGVGYGADLKKAEQVILAAITADPRTFTDPEPFIQVNNLGNSSVDFLVRAWCDSDIYFVYQADMKRAVKDALTAAEVDIPFPTRTVIMEKAGD